jgi:hypothetical protein
MIRTQISLSEQAYEAGMVESGDPQSSQRIDEIVYGHGD